MKKLLASFLFAVALFGAEGGNGFALGLNWGLSNAVPDYVDIKYKGLRIDVGTGLTTGNLDYLIVEPSLTSWLKMYVGLGAQVQYTNSALSSAARVPVGFGVYPFKPFEIFAEAIPSYGLLGDLNGYYTNYGAGFRYHF